MSPRSFRIRRSTMVVVSLALVTSLAACGSDKPNTVAQPKGSSKEVASFTVAVASAPRSMDIAHANDYPSQRAISAAFDRMVALDGDGKVIPWIAESWTQPDPTTYAFKIRSDVKFWDGTPLTSKDVAFSLSRHLDEALGSEVAGQFDAVKSADATDASTVTVTLKTPSSGFLQTAAIAWTIMSEKYAVAAGADLGTPTKPGLGTGPYSIVDYSATDGVTLDRFNGYWGEKPTIKSLKVKVIADPELARLALTSNEIQGYFDVPLIASRKYDALDNTTMTYVNGGYIDLLSMDVKKAPFDDAKVREAVAKLIDRDGLNAPLFDGKGTLATSVTPSVLIDALMGADAAKAMRAGLPKLPTFDVAGAKAALAASTHPEGFAVTLPVDTTQPWMLPLAQNLAENAKALGITVEVKSVSAAEWADALFSPDRGPLQLVALGSSSPNIASIAPLILGEGSINVSEFSTPELVAQMATLSTSSDTKELSAALASASAASNTSLAYFPLFEEQAAFALNKDLVWAGGYSPWALGQVWPLSVKAAG
jgi:peptide/nickel transport system substrate-binding protein